jgi:hypothetical protein
VRAQLAGQTPVIAVDMRRIGRRVSGGVSALLALVLLAAFVPDPAQARKAPLIAAAGDIACGPNNPLFNNGVGTSNGCQELWTSNLLRNRALSAVLPLGDLQYDESGSLESFMSSYDPTWGRWRAVSHPVVGNHEYEDGLGAQGYWDYWSGIGAADGAAGPRAQGWYAYNVGSWRLIALNSNCSYVACNWSSRQLVFLRRQLEGYRRRCVLAYMHHPHFSSGIYEKPGGTRAIWKALYRGGADVVLNGHDHLYERFAPQRPNGTLDHKRGISQFTVGTGGYFRHAIAPPSAPHSQFAYNQGFGVLFMRLGPRRYWWSFAAAPAGVSVDSGSRRCHREKPRRRRRSG